MRSYILHFGLLLIALGSPSFAQSEGSAPVTTDVPEAGDDVQVPSMPVLYELGKPSIVLNCTVPPEQTPVWKKDDQEVESILALKDRYKLEEGGLRFRLTARAIEDDYGNYSCSVKGVVPLRWEVQAKAIAKLHPDMSVVEGQKLKITCKLYGKPYPPVEWTYRASEDVNKTVLVPSERIHINNSAEGVPNGELVIEGITRDDAGRYGCSPAEGTPSETTVRVKGMYDALWPFLGICAEVFVLCTIILVYEKRRTKPELDDSDADNHDQKKS